MLDHVFAVYLRYDTVGRFVRRSSRSKLVCLLLILMVIASGLVGPSVSAQTPVSLDIPDIADQSPDDPVNVPIQFLGNGNNVIALTFSVTFDPCLIFDAVTYQNLPPSWSAGQPAVVGNQLNFTLLTFNLSEVLQDGVFAIMNFSVSNDAACQSKTAPLTFSNASAGSDGGQSIPTETNDGSVEISDGSLAVSLGWFLAERDDALVDFRWQTATETGVAGFHLFAEQDGEMLQLTEELVASRVIDSVTPQEYAFRAATDATDFVLHEVEVSGVVTVHGPFEEGTTYGEYQAPEEVAVEQQIWLPVIRY